METNEAKLIELSTRFTKSQRQNKKLRIQILGYLLYSLLLALVSVLSIDRFYPAILFMILAAFITYCARKEVYEPGTVVTKYQNVPSVNFQEIDISIVTLQYSIEVLASHYIGGRLNAYRGFVSTIIVLQSSYILVAYLLGR